MSRNERIRPPQTARHLAWSKVPSARRALEIAGVALFVARFPAIAGVAAIAYVAGVAAARD